ncbi:LysR family transcriptional regulator [Variovorax beijingensis]|uniref:LysR family transcriptional regulator n=1 Tax=Variovorax beijingensis TaxID=2496117 RepID=A0ABY0A0J3_9BURK|nr:LysR family transcriptional regulator [Variovorax beijingensis]RSZ30807.1 LysR family transcriptional regulator [Variovorax beijingensis]
MDMRLLAVFDEVYKTRSVTRAAENLDIPQTSVSLALARMRRQFNDPLFVRTAEGMVPTPHAADLLRPLRQALELLRVATRQQVVFDAGSSSRHFKICMTDVSHLEFLPRLIHRAAQVAPSIHIEVLRIGPDTRRLLENGEADLAVGYMPELEAGFYQQQLFEQGFSCVVRKDHPRVAKRMTLTLFKREKHVAITAPGTGHDLLQQQLKRLGVERRLALSLPTLPGLGNLLAQSDLIATVPERVAQMLVSIAAVKLLVPPFELPAFAIKQHWHERFHLDPANRWLRSMIAEMFLE